MAEGEIAEVNSVFEQPWWLDTVAPGKWDVACVCDSERMIARLPFVVDRGFIHNPEFTQTLGIWMDDSLKKYQRGNSHLHMQKEIIGELIQQLPTKDNICITLDSSNNYVLPFRWLGFKITPTFSYRIKNLGSMEDVSSIFGKRVLKNIRVANKRLVVDHTSYDLQIILDLQKKTFERQNRSAPGSDRFTLRLMESAIEHNAGKMIVVRDENGIPHSGSFFVYDSNTCYDLIGGQDPKFKNDGSKNLVLYEGIKFASSVSKNFDFEGSMIEGIENFFRQFGGEQVVNYNVHKLSFCREFYYDVLKSRIKRLIGYKM